MYIHIIQPLHLISFLLSLLYASTLSYSLIVTDVRVYIPVYALLSYCLSTVVCIYLHTSPALLSHCLFYVVYTHQSIPCPFTLTEAYKLLGMYWVPYYMYVCLHICTHTICMHDISILTNPSLMPYMLVNIYISTIIFSYFDSSYLWFYLCYN